MELLLCISNHVWSEVCSVLLCSRRFRTPRCFRVGSSTKINSIHSCHEIRLASIHKSNRKKKNLQSNGWNCVLWWFLQKGFYCANLVKCLACVWLFASFAKSWRHKIPLKSRKLHCKYCTAGTIISSTFIWSPTCAQGDGSFLAQDLKEAVYFVTTFLSLFCFQVTQLIFKW